jgi:hypothetical protein
MTRQVVLLDDVVAACQTLQAAGEEVTVRSVRKVTGVGSHTQILKGIHKWRETQGEPPPEVMEAVQQMVRQLWKNSSSITAVTTRMEQLEQLVAVLQARLDANSGNN